MRLEVLIGHKESRLSEELYEDWHEEVVEDGLGLCESVEIASRGHLAHREMNAEEADGRQEGLCVFVFLHGGK